jgi:hypothetical protein
MIEEKAISIGHTGVIFMFLEGGDRVECMEMKMGESYVSASGGNGLFIQ